MSLELEYLQTDSERYIYLYSVVILMGIPWIWYIFNISRNIKFFVTVNK